MTISVKDNEVTLTCDKAATKAIVNVIDVVDSSCNTCVTISSYDLTQPANNEAPYVYKFTLTNKTEVSAFTITTYDVDKNVQESAFYFDSKELYYKEVELLTSYCNTCLDKLQKEKMLLFILKYQLLQHATDNNLIEDQIKYYKDLIKMTNISVKPCTRTICNVTKNVCCNGVCELC